MTQYLYLIRCNTPGYQTYYKVGIAADVESRLAQLQTGSPFELTIEECYGFNNSEIAERAIHQAWAKERGRGEWFELTGDAVSRFQTLCELLGGEVYVPEQYETTPEAIEEAESIQDTNEILLSGLNWRLDPRSGRGWAIFQRGGEKKYLGYVGKNSLKDWEHPTVEEVEMAIAKNGHLLENEERST